MATNTGLKTYTGNCHCGLYKYTLTRPAITSATSCNCSICSRNAYLYIDIPEGSTFKVDRGEGELKRYAFGSKKWVHDFCPKCGITCYVKQLDSSPERFYINARSIQDLDLSALTISTMDGKSWGSPFTLATPIEAPDVEGENLQTYTGQCHCGAVQFAFKSPPIEEVPVADCDCSYCSRTGQLHAYIPHPSITWHGLSNATTYTGVGSGKANHRFCSTCGVYLGIDTLSLQIPEEQRQFIPAEVLENLSKCPTNVRLLNDVDIKGLKIVQHHNGGGYTVE